MATYKSIKYIIPTEAVEHTDSIDALSDVDTTTSAPDNGDVLTWSSSASAWVPVEASASSSTLPTFTSTSPSSAVPSTTTNIVITGSNFETLSQVEFVDTSTGLYHIPNSITFNNSTSLTVNFTLPSGSTNYKIRIENGDGGAVMSSSVAFASSLAPTFSTSNGSLGTIAAESSPSISVSASSDSAITYAITSGALPTGLSLNTSTGAITGTETAGTNTIYNFTITVTDVELQTVDGVFSITVVGGATGGGQFN